MATSLSLPPAKLPFSIAEIDDYRRMILHLDSLAGMSPARISAHPFPHFSLGLAAYTRVCCPPAPLPYLPIHCTIYPPFPSLLIIRTFSSRVSVCPPVCLSTPFTLGHFAHPTVRRLRGAFSAALPVARISTPDFQSRGNQCNVGGNAPERDRCQKAANPVQILLGSSLPATARPTASVLSSGDHLLQQSAGLQRNPTWRGVLVRRVIYIPFLSVLSLSVCLSAFAS